MLNINPAVGPSLTTPNLTKPKQEVIIPFSSTLLSWDWDQCVRHSGDLTPFTPEQYDIIEGEMKNLRGNMIILSDNSAQSIRENGSHMDVYAEGGVVYLPKGAPLNTAQVRNLTATQNDLDTLPQILDEFEKMARKEGYKIADTQVPDAFFLEGKDNTGKLAGIGINYGDDKNLYGTYAKKKLEELLLAQGLSAVFDVCHTGDDCWELKQKGATKPVQILDIAKRFTVKKVVHIGDGNMDDAAGKVACKSLNGGLIAVGNTIDPKQDWVLGHLDSVDDVWNFKKQLAQPSARAIKVQPRSGNRPQVV